MSGTGIAGAQDYVPTNEDEGTWTCAICGEKKSWETSSVRAWIDKGLKQECKKCSELYP